MFMKLDWVMITTSATSKGTSKYETNLAWFQMARHCARRMRCEATTPMTGMAGMKCTKVLHVLDCQEPQYAQS